MLCRVCVFKCVSRRTSKGTSTTSGVGSQEHEATSGYYNRAKVNTVCVSQRRREKESYWWKKKKGPVVLPQQT